MRPAPSFLIKRLGPGDAARLRALQTVFGEAFEEEEAYRNALPGVEYLERLLASGTFIALAALRGDAVIGGIAAYELTKFERERKEIYLYDLAVAAPHRRQGVATALIQELRAEAARRGADVVFVQAHPEDAPAVALYTKLGPREEVLHFAFPSGPSGEKAPDQL